MKVTGALRAGLLALALAIDSGHPIPAHALWSIGPGQPEDYPIAPSFTLRDLHGHRLNLSQYKNRVVLLDFWATWCAPCAVEIPHFIEFQNRYGAQGLQVVGISMDDQAHPVRTFYRKFKMNYPVAMGDLKVAKAYGGVLGLPVTLLIGRDGRIHAKHTGPVDIALLDAEISGLLGTATVPLNNKK